MPRKNKDRPGDDPALHFFAGEAVMDVYKLVPHPDFPASATLSVSAMVDQDDGTLVLSYLVNGQLDAICWPDPAPAIHADGLWKTTCFEAFIGHSQQGYTEYNFSPSGAWAHYSFDWYRDGMRQADWLPSPMLSTRRTEAFELIGRIDLSPHWRDGASHLGLSAVIEERDGTKSYWALAHAPGPPDFHHADNFGIRLLRPSPLDPFRFPGEGRGPVAGRS